MVTPKSERKSTQTDYSLCRRGNLWVIGNYKVDAEDSFTRFSMMTYSSKFK